MRRLLAALAAAALLLAAPAQAASKPILPGIDVSRFENVIDWQQVAEDGIRFAFVQASRGSGDDCTVKPRRCGRDGFYADNYAQATALGIRAGAYHRAFVGGSGVDGVKADARAEARVFIAEVRKLHRGDLRPALDMETPFGTLSALELRVWARAWLGRVGRALGTKPIVYTNQTSWGLMGDPLGFARHGHPLWVANWEVGSPAVPAANWAGQGWRIWQYTSDGHVHGIAGRADLDRLRGGWRGVSVR